MTDFTFFSDQQIITYLITHYDELGVGAHQPDLTDKLYSLISNNHVAIEKQENAFAIIVRANRSHRLIRHYPPESELIYLMVRAECTGKGIGANFLNHVKVKYMENQSMTLVCQGSKRKEFFEKAGFVATALTSEGLHCMVCKPEQKEFHISV